MLENHMVFNTPDAPWNAKDEPENVESEQCIICKRELVSVNEEWFADYHMDHDGKEEFPVGTGDELREAGETSAGFCCSNLCRAEATFRYGDDVDRQSLRSLRDALVALRDNSHTACELLQLFFPYSDSALLVSSDPNRAIWGIAESLLAEFRLEEAAWVEK